MTREELLALRPEEVLAGGLASSLSERLRADGPLALGEQLRADGAPAEALALWVSMLHLAFEAPITGESLERLHRGLKRDATTPRFAAWARALTARLVDRASIEGAIELVFLAHRLRLINDTLRRAD